MHSFPPSLYIHLPWCLSKCPYCDFNSHKLTKQSNKNKYIHALMNDIRAEAERFSTTKLRTIFIGGGTPNLFSPNQIEIILKCVKENFFVNKGCEITMEANPGSMEQYSLTNYKEAGINRLSLGAQSFNKRSLELLGRLHSVEDVYSVYEQAVLADFNSINIDLMYGLPEQNIEMAINDIKAVVALRPQHLSYYQLTIEPNTQFYNKTPENMPTSDDNFAIQEKCFSFLSSIGYTRYEVSAFAMAGYECQHNLNYWRYGDYIAVGAGAHGKYRYESQIKRYQKPANPILYMEANYKNFKEHKLVTIKNSDIIFEYMLNNLRLISGFTENHFEISTGISFKCIEEKIHKLNELGMIKKLSDSHWQPTALGFRFLDDMQAEFLSI